VGGERRERHFLTGRYFEWTVLYRAAGAGAGRVFPNHLAEKHLMDCISLASFVHTTPTVHQLTPEWCNFEKVPVGDEIVRLKALFPCHLGNLVSAFPPTPPARKETRSMRRTLARTLSTLGWPASAKFKKVPSAQVTDLP